jgi:hypothetical protein
MTKVGIPTYIAVGDAFHGLSTTGMVCGMKTWNSPRREYGVAKKYCVPEKYYEGRAALLGDAYNWEDYDDDLTAEMDSVDK